MMTESLDAIFQKTAAALPGKCPLPEPARGAPVIEHPDHLQIRRQPSDGDYDKPVADQEDLRFNQFIAEALKRNEITPEQASKLLNCV